MNVSQGDAQERDWVRQYNRRTSLFYNVLTMSSHKLLGVRLEVEELRAALPNSWRYTSRNNYRNRTVYCEIVPM